MPLTSGLFQYHAAQRPGWQALDTASRLRKRLSPAPRDVRRLRSEIVRLIERAEGVDIRFPVVGAPVMSIVIPVFNNWSLTRRCLASIFLAGSLDLLEVIVVDDASTDVTRQALAEMRGIHVIRNDANIGFTRAANRGAQVARGRYTFFINNDTAMLPGCVAALLEPMSDASIGAAGAKLVYPSGRLQAAGGLIWSDGTGWNIGHYRNPALAEFSVRRDVDYCSAAALVIRTELLSELGYFDERFAPAYYEDTDLCFRVRARGWRVVVEPDAMVVHWEGMTHGTERRRGLSGAHTKANQKLNQVKFVEKWGAELTSHAAHRRRHTPRRQTTPQ